MFQNEAIKIRIKCFKLGNYIQIKCFKMRQLYAHKMFFETTKLYANKMFQNETIIYE